jgi:hypothetical protein
MLAGRVENLVNIRKLGKWSVRSYTMLPLIVKCSIELKKILSIKVEE